MQGSFTQLRPNADSVLKVRLKVVSQFWPNHKRHEVVLSLSLNFPLYRPAYFLIASFSQFSTDNRDPGGAAELNDDEKNTTPSSGRSSSNWKGLDFIRTEDDVDSQLQGTLQRRLTRVLTRKVNHNVRLSCLVGSESTVTVNLTAVGNHRPWVATCPQEYPPDRETGGMGIARDQP